jgi:hypothetical protein
LNGVRHTNIKLMSIMIKKLSTIHSVEG